MTNYAKPPVHMNIAIPDTVQDDMERTDYLFNVLKNAYQCYATKWAECFFCENTKVSTIAIQEWLPTELNIVIPDTIQNEMERIDFIFNHLDATYGYAATRLEECFFCEDTRVAAVAISEWQNSETAEVV